MLRGQGAELVEVAAPTGTTAPSILTQEFERDLDAYLARLPETAPVSTLDEVIAFNAANAQVAPKFGQTLLTASAEIDLDDPTQAAANRRPVPTTFLGTVYAEETLIALASDYDEAAAVRRSPQEINPTAFRCTWVSPQTAPDEDCLAEPAADPVASTTVPGPCSGTRPCPAVRRDTTDQVDPHRAEARCCQQEERDLTR